MVVGLYRMLKRIRCDGSCARGSRLLTRDCCGHGLRYYANSRFPVERDSCRPRLRATLLAARLLDEILADLACELRY